MLTGWLRGYLIVLILVSLLMLPLCMVMPKPDAMLLGKRALVMMGLLWLIAAPLTTGLSTLLFYLWRRYAAPPRAD